MAEGSWVLHAKYRRYSWLGHRLVEGWIRPEVLHIVYALSAAQRASSVVGGVGEIGVHHGRLFIAMHLTRIDGEKSIAIDLFGNQGLNLDGSGKGDRAAFLRNLERHAGGLTDVEVVSADSTSIDGSIVARRVGRVRLFDVDGGHTPDVVAHDLSTADGCVSDGGIVLSDDTFNEQWPGVQEGTARFVESSQRIVPFGIGFNKTMFTTPDHADMYRDVLISLARRRLWDYKESAMYGSPVVVIWNRGVIRKAQLVAKYLIFSSASRS